MTGFDKTELMCKDLGWRNSRESQCKGPVAGTGFILPWLVGLEGGRQSGCFGEARSGDSVEQKTREGSKFAEPSCSPGDIPGVATMTLEPLLHGAEPQVGVKVDFLPQDPTEPSLAFLAAASPGGPSLPEASGAPLYLSSEALTPEPCPHGWTPAHGCVCTQHDKGLSDAAVWPQARLPKPLAQKPNPTSTLHPAKYF